VLFSVSPIFDQAPFRVVHTDVVMVPLLAKIEPDPAKLWRIYENLKLQARAALGGRHRAAVDVQQYLIELWKLCFSLTVKRLLC